jgi:hypothetical protein
MVELYLHSGRAVSQAVIRWLPTAAARHVGFVADKAALEKIFSEYFCFPCQSSFHQFLHHHNHPGLAQQAYLVTVVPSGPNWTPSTNITNREVLKPSTGGDLSHIPSEQHTILHRGQFNCGSLSRMNDLT